MKSSPACPLAICILLVSQTAHAQSADRGFDFQQFRTAPGVHDFITQEGAKVPGGIGFGAGGLLGYQYEPVVIRACGTVEDGTCTDWSSTKGALVAHQLWLDLHGTVSFFNIFEAGLVLPVVLYQGGEPVKNEAGAIIAGAPSGHVGMGDPRLHLKLDIFGVSGKSQERFGLALITVVTFPVGHAIHSDSFMGDDMVTVHPKIAFEVDLGKARLGLNVGYMWRRNKEFFLADMGHRLTYGVAAQVPVRNDLDVILEIFGNSGFEADLATSPLELDAAVRYTTPCGVHITGGAGLGLIAAVGTPWFRLFAGAAWSGHMDKKVEPEPEPEPEQPKDRDGDTIPDDEDQCPKKAEDPDGVEDQDGCPDKDNDGDGILDGEDQCPDEAEDKDAFMDEDGCPDKDNDEDGILDDKDQCPTDKEVFNNLDDQDGCPDKGKAFVEYTKNKILILENVNFATNSDKIVGAKSFEVLDAVVEILMANPDMEVRIEGHTDDKGDRDYNIDLSKRRADAVKKYLVDHGIAEDRVETVGYGPDKPIADNGTKEGRAKNRRVEFFII